MIFHRVADWNNAYANGANIAGGSAWPDAWVGPAKAFRESRIARGKAEIDIAYGEHARHRLDLFLPEGAPKGLVVYIHGGYWMALDKSFWSHLAAGPLAHGFAVAMPSYRLCPEVYISNIVADIGDAIACAAARISGPIHITGHSAGGHLTARMVTSHSPLGPDILKRIRHAMPISGLFDLRPLLATSMNATLQLSDESALHESPALHHPVPDCRLTAWVGGAERAEFRRQNALIANIWTGLGASVASYEEPDRHHFTIIDGLADPDHPLTQTLLG